jgi:hypothetical protein
MRTSRVLAAVLGLAAVASLTLAAPIKKPRPQTEIESIMQAGFGGYPPAFKRPLGKALDGTATKEDLEKLVELSKKLSEQKPPKGDAAEWKKLTAELLDSAKAVAGGGEGKADAVARLKTASNCQACHKAFQLTAEEEKKRVEEYLKKKEDEKK